MKAAFELVFGEFARREDEVIAIRDDRIGILVGRGADPFGGGASFEPETAFFAFGISDGDDGAGRCAAVVAHQPFKIVRPWAFLAERAITEVARGQAGAGKAGKLQWHVTDAAGERKVGDFAMGIAVVRVNRVISARRAVRGSELIGARISASLTDRAI